MSEDTEVVNTNGKNNSSKSQVWEYFKRISINGVYRAECLQAGCGKILSIPNWSTSPLHKHLKNVHQIYDLKRHQTGRINLGRVQHKLSKKSKKELDDLVIEAIVKDGRSFNDFHKIGLKRFLQHAVPGYIPIHRNTVQQKLESLYNHHRKLLINNLSNIDDIAVTIDFWSDRKIKSYLVITGHYVTEDFESESTILQFSSFDQHHYSDIIASEIEKQLNDLGIFHKITTITCDNAPNMLSLFKYLTRKTKRIPCMAHILHLIICNGLGIWTGTGSNSNRNADNSSNTVNANNFDQDLNQSIQSLKINGTARKSLQQNNQRMQNQDASDDEKNDDAPLLDQQEECSTPTADSADDSDVETSEIDDNFRIGLTTDENSTEQIVPTSVEKQIVQVLTKSRQLVSTIKYSNNLRLLCKDLISEYNSTNEIKIKRSLSLDVKSRWNSTHYMLESFLIYRPIIDDLFKNIRKVNLTKKQSNDLLTLEMTNTCWNIVEVLIKVLEPFRHAVQLISGTQYPTIGLTLFVIRKIEQSFLDIVRSDDNEILQKMKQLIREKLIYYTTSGPYSEDFDNFIIHAYFDPYGLSVLTQKEICSIERRLKNLIHSSLDDQQRDTTVSIKQKSTVFDKFLDSIDNDSTYSQHISNRSSTSAYSNETKRYRRLANSYISDVDEDKSALTFWKSNRHSLPNLARLARKYLASPATSVPAESAFSKSAYYGRKERTNLQGDNLCQSVFLKDKLITKAQLTSEKI